MAKKRKVIKKKQMPEQEDNKEYGSSAFQTVMGGGKYTNRVGKVNHKSYNKGSTKLTFIKKKSGSQ